MTSRREFVKDAAIGAAATAAARGADALQSAARPSARRPAGTATASGSNLNVLVITVDTLRWDHVGYAKQNVGWIPEKRQRVKTPNIDRLAERAAIFDRHYIGSFPTIPQRTDCFTGNVNFPRYPWQKLTPQEIILSELLRDAGYYCGLVADTRSLFRSDFTRGFHDAIKTLNPPENRPAVSTIPMPAPKQNYRQNGVQRNRMLSEQSHFTQESDWWVAQTMSTVADWIKENGRRDKWFLWIDTFEVHEVWAPPEQYIQKYDPDYDGGIDYDFPNYGYTDIYNDAELHHLWARYAGEVTLTDAWIGRVLDELDAQNLWDNTLVVLQSDHGMYIGEHGRTGKHTVDYANPWPIYEEVGRVPHLVWMPGRGLPKRVDALTQHADLMPTVLEAVGVSGPQTHCESYLPFLTGDTGPHWDTIYSGRHNPPSDKSKGLITATTNRYAFIAAEDGRDAELYDLNNDPRQLHNIVEREPDIRNHMQKKVANFMREQGAEEAYWKKFVV